MRLVAQLPTFLTPSVRYTPHHQKNSEENASFTVEQMRRVVDAAEAGVRDRMERKVLKAASIGYTKGVAAGRLAETEENHSRPPVARDTLFDDANARDGDSDEVVALRRELETLRNALASGSVSGYDDAASVFSEDSAVIPGGGAGSGSLFGKPPVVPVVRIAEEDSAKEPSVGASSIPEDDAASDGKAPFANATRRGTMPSDAGRAPDEVFVGRAIGTEGKTYFAKPRSGSRGAPTAALWALSVSARDGKIPGVRADALDLISSRCQLFFAHGELSRAAMGWAAARWRLACAEPRRRRAAAAHLERRRAQRTLARCFAAWARRDACDARDAEQDTRRFDDSDPLARRETPAFAERSPRASAPPPRLDRDVAGELMDQIHVLKKQNDELAVEAARAKEALETSGPTPREAAQSEKFRLHLQRLQRELEATKQSRDAALDSADRAAREAAREASARRQSLKTRATQTAEPGDLSGLDAEDQDAVAEAMALELKAQATKFHAEFERQAQIAEAATSKLRDEVSKRARAEDAHRREITRMREKHAADLASARSEWAHRTRVSRANATDADPGSFDESRMESRFESRPSFEANVALEDSDSFVPVEPLIPNPEAGKPRRLTAGRLAALEREAGEMRRSEIVEEKVKGWEVTGVLSEGFASPTISRMKNIPVSSAGGGIPPPAPRRSDGHPEDLWGDAAQQQARRRPENKEGSFVANVQRPPGSVTGSERSTRSRAGTAAAVAAAVRAGGPSAVDALLASGALDAEEDEDDGPWSRPGSVTGSVVGGGSVRSKSARRQQPSATLAVARLVLRGHRKADAEAAVAAGEGNDVATAREWIRERSTSAFVDSNAREAREPSSRVTRALECEEHS